MILRDTTAHGNRYDTGPTVVVAVPAGTGAWNGGVFAGDAPVVQAARTAALVGRRVALRTADLDADDATPLGAFAALVADSPGRWHLVDGPPDLIDLLGPGPCAHLGGGS